MMKHFKYDTKMFNKYNCKAIEASQNEMEKSAKEFIYNIDLTNIILKHKMKEHKMTREEAERIVNLKSYNIGTGSHFNNPKQVVDTLEALGLLKFDDEPNFYKYGITRDNLKALDQAGYKIVKKDGT